MARQGRETADAPADVARGDAGADVAGDAMVPPANPPLVPASGRPDIPVDEDARETPGVVTGAVSIGTAPLPFLAVYAVLFILHGAVHPVHPPDITSTQTGELVCGIVAAVLFVAMATTLLQFLNRRRRWPFAVGQAAVLGASIYFLQDDTVSGAPISALLVVTTLVSLALGFAPDGWRHVGRPVPTAVRTAYRERAADRTD